MSSFSSFFTLIRIPLLSLILIIVLKTQNITANLWRLYENPLALEEAMVGYLIACVSGKRITG
jgi:hypothetical protein